MTKEQLFGLSINKINESIYKEVCNKWDSKQKPLDGLGDFEKITSRILAINKTTCLSEYKKVLVVMCADHGVVEEGVSQCGKEVTFSVAKALGANISSASKMAAYAGCDVITVDVGIDSEETITGVRNNKIKCGTNNFMKNKAMSAEDVLAAIDTGINYAKEFRNNGYNILATGEMGIGNTTSGTAVLCALTGIDVSEVLGRGAGLSDEGLIRKRNVIVSALKKYELNTNTTNKVKSKDDVINIMSSVGGLELAAMTGLFIGGAIYGIPVMIDGVLSAVSALSAEMLVPGCREYMIPSHRGREKGTGYVLDILGLNPLINGDMALGEGTGAVMTMLTLDMALDFYNNALTFDEGEVEQYERLVTEDK